MARKKAYPHSRLHAFRISMELRNLERLEAHISRLPYGHMLEGLQMEKYSIDLECEPEVQVIYRDLHETVMPSRT